MKKVVVLGNGPSLKGFDFLSLHGVDTIGMNAAYRFWDRIGWYPNHYVCLDDRLIETHAAEIFRLIATKKVESAFLLEKILDFYPDLLNDPNVVYLESLVRGKNRRSQRRLTFTRSKPFLDSDSSKITTGAYAVRYAAHLEYNAITLLGIDLRYVEQIPEAKAAQGIGLEITSTPNRNPNYFFDDYQTKGDRYNVPNPASHGTNLHVRSFEVLAYDISHHHWDSAVFNSNVHSKLHTKSIIPYKSLEEFVQIGKDNTARVLLTTSTARWRPSISLKLRNVLDFFAHALRELLGGK